MKKIMVTLLLIIGILVSACGDRVTGPGENGEQAIAVSWTQDIIDADPNAIPEPVLGIYDVGSFNSLALDHSGNVHVSYVVSGELRYATGRLEAWDIATVDDTEDAVAATSIAVDAKGNVHISYGGQDKNEYERKTNIGLKYATNASGQWETFMLDPGANLGTETSIAIDGNGKVHIAYAGWRYGKNIHYITNASGSWLIERLFDNARTFMTMAINRNGKVHIAYNGGTDDLFYATNVSGAWVSTIVDNQAPHTGYHSSIALDNNGRAHISYYQYHGRFGTVMKYTTNESGTWVISDLDVIANIGGSSSIAIDTNGRVHISYCDLTNISRGRGRDLLKYATKARGSWFTSVVDTTAKTEYVGGLFTSNSIAVGIDGKAHVSYQDVTTGYLKYALQE